MKQFSLLPPGSPDCEPDAYHKELWHPEIKRHRSKLAKPSGWRPSGQMVEHQFPLSLLSNYTKPAK